MAPLFFNEQKGKDIIIVIVFFEAGAPWGRRTSNYNEGKTRTSCKHEETAMKTRAFVIYNNNINNTEPSSSIVKEKNKKLFFSTFIFTVHF